ncbi:unnamed protein product [Spirodela intermedia]|uniref:Uncharacterized protein n=2 Tax=Spirodela intermedia TaxID=51605 RepID=A0A7I8IIV9_SPIIN|nr:unnamed protein product [Spirodela intermedia]CAA6657289.1 unnamed protein product [Spirodela intermedia]CAA7393333.1 unnamed protein product [Spirodela intermedia]
MGRGEGGGGGDSAAVYSSIALLQERFRRLQRVREMREERELLRAYPGTVAHSCEQQRAMWFVRPAPPPRSFRPETARKHAELTACAIRCPNGPDEMDAVDTSLHL